MGIIVKHVQSHPKTGRLSFRRAYPPELLPFIPAGRAGKAPAALKVSLGTKDASSAEFHTRYSAALARFETTVAKARKAALGTYDTLDAPTIAHLGQLFEHEWLEQDERARWAKGPEGAERARAGWEWKLPDFKQWRADGDLDSIEEQWRDSACKLLEAQGLTLDPNDHASRQALCRELNDAAIRVSGIAQARLAGEVVPTPDPPSPLATVVARRTPSVPLLATFDAYAEAALKPLTAQDWRRCIVHLTAFLGHDDATKLTTDDLMRWRDQLLREPTKRGDLRGAGTVRGKYLGSVKAMLNWAVDERKLATNVALSVKVRETKKAKLRNRDFSDAEAQRILAATVEPVRSNVAPEYARARRWIPWLCAYTGARVNELSQLRGEDVAELEGVWTIRITPEAGTVKAQEARIVPVHPHLIEQGFLELVDSLGKGPLFYDPGRQRVHAETNRHVRKVGERLAEWVRKDVGIADPNVSPNHGWRHRFKTQALAVGIPERVADALQGHAPKTVGQSYGSVPIPTLAAAVASLPKYLVPLR
jgi:integrase